MKHYMDITRIKEDGESELTTANTKAFEVGDHIRIVGRIQSREYIKKLTETESEKRTAYEVSVDRLEVLDERDQS